MRSTRIVFASIILTLVYFGIILYIPNSHILSKYFTDLDVSCTQFIKKSSDDKLTGFNVSFEVKNNWIGRADTEWFEIDLIAKDGQYLYRYSSAGVIINGSEKYKIRSTEVDLVRTNHVGEIPEKIDFQYNVGSKQVRKSYVFTCNSI